MTPTVLLKNCPDLHLAINADKALVELNYLPDSATIQFLLDVHECKVGTVITLCTDYIMKFIPVASEKIPLMSSQLLFPILKIQFASGRDLVIIFIDDVLCLAFDLTSANQAFPLRQFRGAYR